MIAKLDEMPNLPIAANVEAIIGIDDCSIGMTIMDTPPNIINADMLVVRLKYSREKSITTYAGISTKPLLCV